jgi:hypothetical protein
VCDLPAARQTSGFMSHAAKINCAYCLNCSSGRNSLQHTGPQADWRLRTDETQRKAVEEWCAAARGAELDADDEEEDDAEAEEADPNDKDIPTDEEGEEDGEEDRGEPIDEPEPMEDDEPPPPKHRGCERLRVAAAAKMNGEAAAAAAAPPPAAAPEPMEVDEPEPSPPPPKHRGSERLRAAAAVKNDEAAAAVAAPPADAAPAGAAPAAAAPPPAAARTQKQLEYTDGARWSALLDLEYFDPVRCTPVDVMHNMYLGCVKAVMMLFTKGKPESKERSPTLDDNGEPVLDRAGNPRTHATYPARRGCLTAVDLMRIQAFMKECKTPSDVGRIPAKIASKMKHFKAEQWKLWASIYWLPAMRHVRAEDEELVRAERITPDHIQLVWTLHQLSVLLQAYTITPEQVSRVHALATRMLQQVEALYGPHAVRPNMHLVAHLAAQLRDYGPPAGWWCNSYERYNGLLVNVPYTPSHVEAGIMKRFILLVDVTVAMRRYLDDIDAGRDAATGPTSDDYLLMLNMLSGTEAKLSDPLAAAESALQVSTRRTASGRHQTLYTFHGRQWLDTYKQFMLVRRNAVGPEPTRAHLYGNAPRVVGNEPFPGAMLGATHFNTRASNPFTSLEKWPPAVAALMPAEHLMQCLRTHFALAYTARITSNYCGWTDATHLSYDGSSRDRKLAYLTARHTFALSTRFVLYGELAMAGDHFGSKLSKTSQSSSFVGLWGPDVNNKSKDSDLVHINQLKYGQVQFYFTTEFTSVRHSFAVMRYYELDDDNYFADDFPDIDVAFPTSDMALRPLDLYNVVPVQTIAFRWIPCYQAEATRRLEIKKPGKKFYQICPVPSKIHA